MAGLVRRLRRSLSGRLLLAGALVALTFSLQPSLSQRAEAEGCVFPFTPTTYEDLRDRRLFLDTIELAAFNYLFPGDPYFGLPDIELGPREHRVTQPGKVPPVLLKAIAYVESSLTQAAADAPFGSIGPALVAFDCGHGISQVTTGMTLPDGENGRGSPEQALVSTHYAYNIARGAAVLVEKWNEAPEEKPIAGTNTGGHPALLENWYFAIWNYNGFTGPGANRSNHPMDPIYGSWPRTQYSCGPEDDGLGHNRTNYPYQELILGCATNPPVVDGSPLWDSQPISLPDLDRSRWSSPLDVDNFVFPYGEMDIQTPQPFHMDMTPAPDPSKRSEILGEPGLLLNLYETKVPFATGIGSAVRTIDIYNAGNGILTWYATPSASWLNVETYTGIAAGLDVHCEPEVPCDRVGHLRISVDYDEAPPGDSQAQVVVQALGSPQRAVINVNASEVISPNASAHAP